MADTLSDFVLVFVGVCFNSFVEFKAVLDAYEHRHFVHFVVTNSRKCKIGRLKYDEAVYRCIYCPRRQSNGRGLRRSFTRSTDCNSRFLLRRRGSKLVVTSYQIEHNHLLNESTFYNLPSNRRLTVDEVAETGDLLRFNAPTSSIKDFLSEKYGKKVTTQSIINLRHKVKGAYSRNLDGVMTMLRLGGRALESRDEKGDLTHLAFARTEQIALFARFPEVVCVDGTHSTNRQGFILYQFLITDGMGIGRTVLFAFIKTESLDSITNLFLMFREIMGTMPSSRIRTFVMDKMAAQMNAVRGIFGCDIVLCYFHMRQAVRGHTNGDSSRNIIHLMATRDCEADFGRHLQMLRERDPRFVQYLTANWLAIKRLWAVHAQKGLVHLGNTTNNRVENAHGRLKKNTHHRDSLVVAIQKVWNYSLNLLDDYATRASYGCDRHERLSGDPFMDGLLRRLTTYAARQVRLHLKGKLAQLPSEICRNRKFIVRENGECYDVDASTGRCNCIFSESMLLPCIHLLSVFRINEEFFDNVPVEHRWLASYNLPLQTISSKFTTQRKDNPASQYLSWLQSTGSKIFDESVEKGEEWFRDIYRLTLEKFPILRIAPAPKKQPRWHSENMRPFDERANFPRQPPDDNNRKKNIKVSFPDIDSLDDIFTASP